MPHDKMPRTKRHTVKMPQDKTPRTKCHTDKMSHGQNATGQNATWTKCHRTKCHTDKMPHGQHATGKNITQEKFHNVFHIKPYEVGFKISKNRLSLHFLQK